MRTKRILALLVAAAALSQSTLSAELPIRPSAESARRNAFLIFNSVHAAMRQWGSSLHHNGMSLIPATVPRGTVLYHGCPSNATPIAPEWLAFEMEHSENFARSRPYRNLRSSPPSKSHHPNPNPDDAQRPLTTPSLSPPNENNSNTNKTIRGYLHTFIATRPLHLLYIDGSSAGNTFFGTLDTQDYILRLLDPKDNRTNPWGEFRRAADLCALVTSWGYDGVIRMEIGFEVIYCDFAPGKGLEEVSVVRSPGLDGGEWNLKKGREGVWRWARAVAERYEGIGGGRVKLEFSRMVSGLWYPVDVSNPDGERGREGLPRLVGVTLEERKAMRGRLEELVKGAVGESVDWQGVVDMVVARYGERLGYMASEGIESERFVREVFAVTDSYVEYPPAPGDVTFGAADSRAGEAHHRCAVQYLLHLKSRLRSWSEEDEMLYAAIWRVMERICETLFGVRVGLEEIQPDIGFKVLKGVHIATDGSKMQDAIQQGREAVRSLAAELRWTTWKKCRGCAVDEVCFVAMWPFGRVSDHYSPGCLRQDIFETTKFWEDSYWG